jgi:hypothetical protein
MPMKTDQIIDQLTSDLEPVRVLRSPALRALCWLALVGAVTTAVVLGYANSAALQRLTAPRVAVECVATALTAIAAIVAAFELSVPDGSPRWVWLPVPPLLVWLAASGLGCLRNGVSLRGGHGAMGNSPDCFMFICAASLPLAVGLFWMLRHARPIAPLPVAATGALGVAATAAFILEFFHPFDVTVIDLTLHVSAVCLVVVLVTSLRRPLLDDSARTGS